MIVDAREAVGEVVSVAGEQPDALGVLPGKDAKAVMFDFVDPIWTHWRLFGGMTAWGQARPLS
jgi:hypothetical protein